MSCVFCGIGDFDGVPFVTGQDSYVELIKQTDDSFTLYRVDYPHNGKAKRSQPMMKFNFCPICGEKLRDKGKSDD